MRRKTRRNKKARPKPGYASHLARIYDSRNLLFVSV
nr:MAG TPA: hypothetical protein [Caudoviricetes sp.]